MYNNNFNEEMENELNLGGKCIPISDNDKGTPNDYANLESKIVLKTEASLPVGCELDLKAKENINNTLLNTLGISYDEFDKLDFDEQQKIIRQYHKKNSKSKDKSSFVMIDYEERSCFGETGLTPEEEIKRLDDELYSKPISLVKKKLERFKKINSK